MKIVCISDTHGLHNQVKVPDGDLLIHAGDLTNSGTYKEAISALNWISNLPHKHKVVIAGNHDFCFEKGSMPIPDGVTYLENSGVEIEGFKIWGSPITPWFRDWAFNRHRGEEIKKYWDMIPDDTNILITHGPPEGFGDMNLEGKTVGCKDLLFRIEQLNDLNLHIFGHIHEGYGNYGFFGGFINACVVNRFYQVVNKPIEVEL